MDTLPPKNKRPTVGLDAPCQKCGRPIYYNYKGPVEGLCGRCADGSRQPARFHRNSRRIGFFEGERRPVRIAAVVVLAVAVAAVTAFLIFTVL